MITLYELTGAEENRRFSPFVWRTRMALAHKELEFEGVPWRFTEKEELAASGSRKVPVIRDHDQWIHDSWKISEYLEDTYPDRPSLFGGKVGRAEALFLNAWADTAMLGTLFPMMIADIHKHLAEKDKAYFRETREQRLGGRLEDVQADRDQRVEHFRKILTPLRMVLSKQPFICGDSPAYGDYIVFGPFQWVRAVSPFKVLEADDPVYQWRSRMMGLFDGMPTKFAGYDV